MWSFLCPQGYVTLLVLMCGKNMEYWQSEKLIGALVSRVFIGPSLYDWLIVHVFELSLQSFPSPEDRYHMAKSTLNHMVVLSGGATLRLLVVDGPKLRHLCSLNCRVWSKRPPWIRWPLLSLRKSYLEIISQEDKSQTYFWARPNSLPHNVL